MSPLDMPEGSNNSIVRKGKVCVAVYVEKDVHAWLKKKGEDTNQTIVRVATQILNSERGRAFMDSGKTFRQAIQECVQLITERA